MPADIYYSILLEVGETEGTPPSPERLAHPLVILLLKSSQLQNILVRQVYELCILIYPAWGDRLGDHWARSMSSKQVCDGQEAYHSRPACWLGER